MLAKQNGHYKGWYLLGIIERDRDARVSWGYAIVALACLP
jgi:hypothetical protein